MKHLPFHKLVVKLRAEAPPLFPVRVYVRDRLQDGWLGTTELRFEGTRPARFVVMVKRSVAAVMRDTLLHEWAHAIAWREGHETVCDHDPEWALAYSRIYQMAVEP